MKKLIITTLLLFAVVLTGCFHKSVVNENVNDNQEEIDISGWKTYRNEEYGFEFKYPGDWILSNLEKGISIKYSKKWEFGMKEGFTPFSVEIKGGSLQDFIKSYEDDFLDGAPLTKIISQERYNLDGESGTKLIGNNAAGINSYHIFVSYNQRNYLISFNENEEVQRAMLSIFHFLK